MTAQKEPEHCGLEGACGTYLIVLLGCEGNPCNKEKCPADTRQRPATTGEQRESLDWMKPLCFGKHEAICDSRCKWEIRKRCIASIRKLVGENP